MRALSAGTIRVALILGAVTFACGSDPAKIRQDDVLDPDLPKASNDVVQNLPPTFVRAGTDEQRNDGGNETIAESDTYETSTKPRAGQPPEMLPAVVAAMPPSRESALYLRDVKGNVVEPAVPVVVRKCCPGGGRLAVWDPSSNSTSRVTCVVAGGPADVVDDDGATTDSDWLGPVTTAATTQTLEGWPTVRRAVARFGAKFDVEYAVPRCGIYRLLESPPSSPTKEFHVHEDGYLETRDGQVVPPDAFCVDEFAATAAAPAPGGADESPAGGDRRRGRFRGAVVCQEFLWRPPNWALDRTRLFGKSGIPHRLRKCCKHDEVLDREAKRCVKQTEAVPAPSAFPVVDSRDGRLVPSAVFDTRSSGDVVVVVVYDVLARDFVNFARLLGSRCATVEPATDFHLLDVGALYLPGGISRKLGQYTRAALGKDTEVVNMVQPEHFCIDAKLPDPAAAESASEVDGVGNLIALICEPRNCALEQIRPKRMIKFHAKCPQGSGGPVCVPKCCPKGMMLVGDPRARGGQRCVPLLEGQKSWSPDFYEVLPNKSLAKVTLSPEEEYKVVDDLRPFCPRDTTLRDISPVLLGPTDTGRVFLSRSGHLEIMVEDDDSNDDNNEEEEEEEGEGERHAGASSRSYPPGHFCVDAIQTGAASSAGGRATMTTTTTTTIGEVALVCQYPADSAPDRAVGAALVASSVFLLLTILLVVTAECSSGIGVGGKLSNWILLNYLGCWLLSTFVTAWRHLAEYVTDENTCVAIVSVNYFAQLSAYFWVNTMSFDIWHSLWRKMPVARSGHLLRFAQRCLYSYGLPTLLTGTLLFLQFGPYRIWLEDPPIHHVYGLWCNFRSDVAIFTLYYGPLGFALVGNIVFFVMTTVLLLQHRKTVASLKLRNQQRNTILLITKLFILMCLNWASQIVSWLSLCSQEVKRMAGVLTAVMAILSSVAIFLVYLLRPGAPEEAEKGMRLFWEFSRRQTERVTRRVSASVLGFTAGSRQQPDGGNNNNNRRRGPRRGPSGDVSAASLRTLGGFTGSGASVVAMSDENRVNSRGRRSLEAATSNDTIPGGATPLGPSASSGSCASAALDVQRRARTVVVASHPRGGHQQPRRTTGRQAAAAAGEGRVNVVFVEGDCG